MQSSLTCAALEAQENLSQKASPTVNSTSSAALSSPTEPRNGLRLTCLTVRIGTSTSTPLPVTHGVSQCAILSPLLFCIHISDLPLAPQVCNLESYSYVDDSKIFLSFPIKDAESTERVLQEDLRQVAAWCCKNQLLINPDKTKFLMVGTQQLLRRLSNEISISFLGKEITPVFNAKDLGIILDNLTYDQYIHQITSNYLIVHGQTLSNK